MKIEGEAKLLRIFVGESDKAGKVPVYEKIVIKARKEELAGATVYRGIMGFGGHSVIHTAKILTISEDLPLVIEIVDEEKRIEDFIPIVEKIFEESNCGGLITTEKADIIKYTADEK
jgi:PII-like signaling protein